MPFSYLLFLPHKLKVGDSMVGEWLVLCIVLVVIECLTVNLVCIWFALGALLAAISSLFLTDTMMQGAVFVFSSILFFFLLKPFSKKMLRRNVERTNLDRVIGQIGVVTEKITKIEPGEVKVDGKKWSAISSKTVKVGSKVEILSIEGVKLLVKEVDE